MPTLTITDYASLKAAVADWLNRADLTDQIPEFIALAEARIIRTLRRTTATATVPTNGAAVTLPVDCAELRGLVLSTSVPYRDRPLPIVTPEMLAEQRAMRNGAVGRPQYAAVVGGQILLAPVPDQSYDLVLTYFQKLVPLSGTVATNSLLAEAPDAYLYGALCVAASFLQHDDRVPLWDTMFTQAIQQLNDRREQEEYGASLRPVRIPVVF